MQRVIEHERAARWAGRAAIATAACVVLASCASAPTAPPTIDIVVEQPPADPLTPAERLLALLTADNPQLERVAMSLSSMGDRAILRTAGDRLVALARAIGTPAWREAERARIQLEADEDPRSTFATEAQLEERETRALTSVLAAMFHVGGSAVVGYCFALAEDDKAPAERRRLALRVLDRVVDPGDTARIERRAQLAARVQPFTSLGARRATEAIAQLRRAFVACHQRALKLDPAIQARVQIKLHVGARGKVRSAVEGDRLPPELERCLTNAVTRITSLDQEEPGTQMTVPFVFSTPR